MAKRGTTAGKKKAGRGRRTGGSGRARTTRKRTSTARRGGAARRSARRSDAARQLRAEDASATEIAVVMGPDSGRDAAQAQDRGETAPQVPSTEEGWMDRAAAGSAAEVHDIEEAAQRREAERAAREALRAHEASAELERRRQEEWRTEERPETPGVTSMAVELLLGGMRLVRAIATAPLRLGLAFLDRSA